MNLLKSVAVYAGLAIAACSPSTTDTGANSNTQFPTAGFGTGPTVAGSAATGTAGRAVTTSTGTAGTISWMPAGASAMTGTAGVTGAAGTRPGGAAGTTATGAAGRPATAGIGAAGSGSGAAGAMTSAAGAAGSSMGAAGGGTVKTAKDPKIPPVMGDCPMFKEGTTTADFMGLKSVIFEVGPKANGTGSLIFYWHGTGSVNAEYSSSTVQPAVLMDIKSKGGILVSPQSGTGTGGDCSGTGTFAEDDFKTADQIAACAVRDWNIDPHRIWSTGCSAGGLQAGCMSMMRSSYLAGAVPNSGGEVVPIPQEDMSHVPSMMTIHGAPGQDVVIVDFSNTSATMDDAVKKAGGFAIDCNHGGGHCGLPMLPAEASMTGWQFMQDHPFGVSPEPYASGLPASFPKYCKIW